MSLPVLRRGALLSIVSDRGAELVTIARFELRPNGVAVIFDRGPAGPFPRTMGEMVLPPGTEFLDF
jgi:hypothetical protein